MGGPRQPPLLLQRSLLLTPRLELIMTQQLLLAVTLHSRQVTHFCRLNFDSVAHALRHFLKKLTLYESLLWLWDQDLLQTAAWTACKPQLKLAA